MFIVGTCGSVFVRCWMKAWTWPHYFARLWPYGVECLAVMLLGAILLSLMNMYCSQVTHMHYAVSMFSTADIADSGGTFSMFYRWGERKHLSCWWFFCCHSLWLFLATCSSLAIPVEIEGNSILIKYLLKEMYTKTVRQFSFLFRVYVIISEQEGGEIFPSLHFRT